MKVLVTGAQFNNKGAQSLLFTLISELKKRYEGCEIYYLPIDNCFLYDPRKYQFHIVYDDMAWNDRKECIKEWIHQKLVCLNQELKWLKSDNKNLILKLSNTISKIDVMVDISGLALSSKNANRYPSRYLRLINLAKANSKPVILMPQSFGPFEYGKEKNRICIGIQKVLNKVDLIYSREKDGTAALMKDIVIDNEVYESPDLVLQSIEPTWDLVYTEKPSAHVVKIESPNSVGIIPNNQLLKVCNKSALLQIYGEIIKELLDNGKEIYIFRHSNDLDLCEDIYSIIQDSRIHIIRDEMSCFDFSDFISQFQFVIASRYHSIVHSYKQGVPAVILGWAIKYKDLAEQMNQSEYVLDFSCIDNDTYLNLRKMVKMMCFDYAENRIKILNSLALVRNNSKLSKAWNLLSEINNRGEANEN